MAAILVPCPNAVALEDAFLARLEKALQERRRRLSPITVVAPTARLLQRLQGIAARRFRAVVGIHFLLYQRLAERVLIFATGDAPACLSRAGFEGLVEACVRDLHGSLDASMTRYRSTRSTLARTLRELREAGASRRLSEAPLWLEKVEPVRAKLEAALARMRAGGRVDEAGLIAEAADRAASSASRLGPVLHVGAYDLTPVLRRLFQSLARRTSVEHLVLGLGSEGPAFRWASKRATLFGGALASVTTSPDQGGGGRQAPTLLSERVALLFDDRASLPAPLPEDTASFIEAPGPDGELEAAARQVLRWHSEGTPLEEIAILARSLEPYAAHIAPALSRHGLPFSTHASLPLLREPAVQALLDFLEVLASDLPRRALSRLLRSPHLALSAFTLSDEWKPDAYDRLSRRHGIRGGIEAFRTLPDLEAATAASRRSLDDAGAPTERLRAARALAAACETLHAAKKDIEPGPESSWASLVARTRSLAARFLREDPSARSGALDAALGSLGDLADLDGALPPPSIEEFLVAARRQIEAAREPLRRPDRGGVRVLDLMQARGLSFDCVALIGCHDGSLPRVAEEDPYLHDHERRELSSALGIDLRAKGDNEDEERLLLALALGSARRAMAFLWQHSDAAQRRQSVSPYLREIVRVTRGEDHLEGVIGRHTIPSHPLRAAETIVREQGLLDPGSALVAIALSAGALRGARVRDAALALGMASDARDRGLAHVEATDAFDAVAQAPDALRFDGFTIPAPESTLSVTAFERLGRCPLQFFFQHRLRLSDDLQSPEEDEVFDARLVGILVHQILKALYRRLPWDDPGASGARLLEASERELPAAVEEALGAAAPGPLASYPAVARAVASGCRDAVARFVAADLPALASRGIRSVRAEEPFEGSLDLDLGRLSLRGRFDRLVLLSDGSEEVADYKTGAVRDIHKIEKAIRGQELQLALYALLREREVGIAPVARGIWIRPFSDPAEDDALALRSLERPDLERGRTSLMRTLSDLHQLHEAGVYPLASDPERCRHCGFLDACRTAHAPTRSRVEGAAACAPYYALSRREPLKERR